MEPDKQLVLEAIMWSEGLAPHEAEFTYSVTSARYHRDVVRVYENHIANSWKRTGVYHPIYNPDVETLKY